MKNSTKFSSFNCADLDQMPNSKLCKQSDFSNNYQANYMPKMLNRLKVWMIFFAFFLFNTSVQTFSQNLLSNNSFDSGITGWSASPVGSIYTFSGQYAYAGNSLTLNNNDYWGHYYTWQSINATAGIKYDISFMASTHNPVYYAAVGYEFYNSFGLIIGKRVEKRVTGSVYNSSRYSKYEFLGVTAPAGTAKLRVVGYTSGTALKLDNVSVSLTSTCSNVTSGGAIGSNQTGCSGFDPTPFTSVTAPSGGAGALEIIWMKSTTSSVLNSTTQNQWSVIPGATGLTYDAGPVSQTTYFTRCSRRAGCTAYVGESNVITMTVNTNCLGKDPVCLSRKSTVLSSSLCGDATKSYGLWFNDLKGNVASPSQYFTVKSGELTEFCDGTAVLNIVGCVKGGGVNDCITATVNFSGRTGTPPAGSPLSNTHCTGYAPNVGDWYYYPTSNGTFSGTGIFAGLTGTYTQNMAAFQVGTGGSLNDISKFGASSWFKINITNGGINHWTTTTKDGDINVNLGTATNIASVTASANPNSICKGSNVVLTATLDAASKSANCSPTYSWVGSNGFTSTQATVTNANVQAATTYTVTVTFTAKNGSKCSVTGTTAVAISANCCDNVTNGGQIAGNQRNCGAFDPAPFTNVTLPSGGTGTLEYLWLRSTTASTYTAANASEWIPIVGSNSATLDLTNISQTTYFQRCSRRAGCTDYVGETNVVSVIIDPLPTAPAVTLGSICGTGTVTLGATCGTGTTAMWYSALTGGTSIASGATYTTPSLTATTTYYVSCKSSAGCESVRTSVVATVTPKITDGGKIQADETICTGSTPSKITSVSLPNGGVGSIEYLWLQTTSLTNGVCPANIAGQTLYSPIANTNTSEYQPGAITQTTCYIRCSRLTGCTDYTGESNIIKKTVGSIGVAPTVRAGSVCGTGTVTLGATCGTGTIAMWYSALTGGTSIASGASFTTASLSATTTYYVSCKSSAGCESVRTSVVATVTPKITDGGKIQADETICTGSTPSKITNVTLPNGGVGSIEYLWLQTTSLTNGVCPANIAGQTLYSPIANTNTSEYQPGAITTTTCYIRCSRLTGCTDYTGESNIIKKTVGSIGVAPTVRAGSICGTGTVTLGATCGTGTTAMWYSALTGGTSIASGATYTTPSLTATTTYYVSCKSSAGCESVRTSVVATVNGSLSGPSAIKNGTICGTGSVELGAVCTTGTPMWYATATGGTSFTTGSVYVTPVLTATTTYYVSCKSTAGCESPRIEVKATVVAKITNGGTIKSDETLCGSGTPAKITNVTLPSGGDVNTAIEYVWLQTTTLSNGACPLNVVGQNLYTEIANSNTADYQPGAITQTTCYIRCSRRAGCTDYIGGESNTVKKTVGSAPVAPTVASGSICGTGTVTLGATCSTGATAMWYSASTGGSSIASGASFTTPSLSASATYYVSCKSNASCESARTAVTATVNGSASAPTVTPATTCGAGSVTLGATCSAGVATWYSSLTGGSSIASGSSYTTPNLSTTTSYYVSCKAGTGCESPRIEVKATVVAKITNGGTIKSDETLCGSGTPAKIVNVTLPSGGDVNAAIEYVWLQTTTLSNGACPLNVVGQNLYTEIANSNTADYQPGAITQTTCYIRCSRRAGCTDYIGGESNTVKKTVTTPFTVTPSTNANAVCAGTTVSITLSTTAIGMVSYSWTGPNGFTANTKDVVIANSTVANNGVYTVSVSNGTGCSAVATVHVKVANCLKLGDSVFNDKNNNGKQDAGEVGISGVSVKLYDNANNLVGTATTDVNGKYLFSNLAPGDYVVEIVAPAGYKSSTGTIGSATGSAEPAVDPDNNVDGDDNGTTLSGQTIRTKPVTLTVTGGDNLTVDFGLFKPAQIGDYVFRDSNGNGKQDAGEGGVSGVTVKLYDSANNVIATTTTDASGKYLFDNLIAGNYTVEFVKSTIGSGFSFSPKGATTSDKDSDADLTTGKTATITLTEGQVNKDIDAGVTTPCDTDTTPPVLSACPADIIIKTRGTSATITWTEPTATDNCGTVVLTSTSASGSQFPVGTTTVTYTATDAKGNKATCSFVVNVVKMVTCDVDTQAPVFYDCPTDISVVTTGTSAVVLWDHPAVGDNCGIPNITYNFEPGMSFPVGVTTVTYKAVDAKGNTSYCSFKVTVTKKATTSTLTNAAARVAVAEDVTFTDNVTIYPNPSSSDCSIELSAELMRANKSVEVSILSTAGNIEFSQTATGTERTSVKVPVENMPSGTYFVNVGLENGRMIIKKLQIVK